MSVVFPWSTCAITATLRRRLGSNELLGEVADDEAAAGAAEKAREGAVARGIGLRDLRAVDGHE